MKQPLYNINIELWLSRSETLHPMLVTPEKRAFETGVVAAGAPHKNNGKVTLGSNAGPQMHTGGSRGRWISDRGRSAKWYGRLYSSR